MIRLRFQLSTVIWLKLLWLHVRKVLSSLTLRSIAGFLRVLRFPPAVKLNPLPYFIFIYFTLPYLRSPHLGSPHLTSPHLTSSHLTSPDLTSSHLTSPHLTWPHLTSSLLYFTLLYSSLLYWTVLNSILYCTVNTNYQEPTFYQISLG